MDLQEVTAYVAKEDGKDEAHLLTALTSYGLALGIENLYDSIDDDFYTSTLLYKTDIPCLLHRISDEQKKNLDKDKDNQYGKAAFKHIDKTLREEYGDSDYVIRDKDLTDGMNSSLFARPPCLLNLAEITKTFDEKAEQERRVLQQCDEILSQKRAGLNSDPNKRGPACKRRNQENCFGNSSDSVPVPVISSVHSLASGVPLNPRGFVLEGVKHKAMLVYWKCLDCPFACPINLDNQMITHVRIRHAKDIDDSSLLKYKLRVEIDPGIGFLSCKKCKQFMLATDTRNGASTKLESHRLKCSPDRTSVQLFEPYVEKRHQCGICNRKSFLSRIDIASHVWNVHTHFVKRFLYDPFFRCGQCFKEFKESRDLIVHLHSTSSCKVLPETICQLANRLKWCGIDGRLHPTVGSAQQVFNANGLIRCILCGFVATEKAVWVQHRLKCHSQLGAYDKEKKMTCPFCEIGHEPMDIRRAMEHIDEEHFSKCKNPQPPTITIITK